MNVTSKQPPKKYKCEPIGKINFDGKRLKDTFGWDKNKGGYYYNSNGRKVPDRILYKATKEEVDRIATKIEKTTNQLLGNRINFEQWQLDMTTHVKNGHVLQARLGRGGKDNTFAIHYLDVATELRVNQYPRLRRFAKDIKDGKLTEKQILSRAKLYGLSTKSSFEKARLSNFKKDDKIVLGRRRLGACAPHCASCLRYAGFGWIGLDKIIPPGQQCECGGNCCCSVEIREEG